VTERQRDKLATEPENDSHTEIDPIKTARDTEKDTGRDRDRVQQSDTEVSRMGYRETETKRHTERVKRERGRGLERERDEEARRHNRMEAGKFWFSAKFSSGLTQFDRYHRLPSLSLSLSLLACISE
jgi:hypothetical protein